MGLFKRTSKREQRDTLSNPSVELVRALTGGFGSSAGVDVSPDAAMRHADVYACVRAISEGVASLPLITYRRLDADGRSRLAPIPGTVAYVLAHPSPTLTPADLWGTVLTHLNLRGNAFLVKYRDELDRLAGLGVLAPSRVTVSVVNGEPVYKVAKTSGSSIAGTFTRRDFVHIKGLSLDGILGLSPIAQAREAIGLGIAAERYAATFWANSAHPAGILKMADTLTPAAQERLKAGWESQHQGAENANRVAILENGVEWESTSIPLEDSQFVEQRQFSTGTIARIFGVPPWRIGASGGDSMTYSNVESQDLAFAKHTLRPWLVRIEQALKADSDLFPVDGAEYPEFLVDAMLRADSATRASVYAQGFGRWLTTNDIRRAENLAPLTGGDELVTPATPPPLAK